MRSAASRDALLPTGDASMNAVTAGELTLDDLVDPRERVLGGITLVLGVLVWVIVVVGTLGIALLVMLAVWVMYLFVHSALIAHVKGNGVEISVEQLPDVQARLDECCERLQIRVPPQAYVLNGNGLLNAFATHFLRAEYIILTSDVVDAMLGSEEGMRFYIGHELGHLRMKHLTGQLLRAPVLWLPLLGAAYSRSRERTCDRHGNACSGSAEASVRALGALAAGKARWRKLNVSSYLQQAREGRGFWMSFHELVSGYPWLTRRAAYVMGDRAAATGRNPLAYILALFVPFGGPLGAGFSFLLVVYVIVMAAVVAVPRMQQQMVQTRLEAAVTATAPAREKLVEYYTKNHDVPASLEQAGVAPSLPGGLTLSLNPQNMAMTVTTAAGELIMVPRLVENQIRWSCTNGNGITPAQLPTSCR
jgi:Zn-dependent protease with chaperone function